MQELTKRQLKYRAYLATEHWASLRLAALARDGGKCIRCGEEERLQVHHRVYRGRYEDSVLEDVETLCRKCHRLEHGIGPSDQESLAREMEHYFNYQRRPPIGQWLELRRLIKEQGDIFGLFGDLMFKYVSYVLAHEREGATPGWWMNPEKKQFWFKRAHRLRQRLNERNLSDVGQAL